MKYNEKDKWCFYNVIICERISVYELNNSMLRNKVENATIISYKFTHTSHSRGRVNLKQVYCPITSPSRVQ